VRRDLTDTDIMTNQTCWIGIESGSTGEMLSYVTETIDMFVQLKGP
jgi:hypothetical protein